MAAGKDLTIHQPLGTVAGRQKHIWCHRYLWTPCALSSGYSWISLGHCSQLLPCAQKLCQKRYTQLSWVSSFSWFIHARDNWGLRSYWALYAPHADKTSKRAFASPAGIRQVEKGQSCCSMLWPTTSSLQFPLRFYTFPYCSVLPPKLFSTALPWPAVLPSLYSMIFLTAWPHQLMPEPGLHSWDKPKLDSPHQSSWGGCSP